MTVVILCGGKATRLGSETDETPKSLLPVAGKPFIQHQLDILKAQGFNDVVLCLSHLGQKIIQTIPKVKWFMDDPPLGTGGVVAAILPNLSDPFMVMNGDAYPGWDLTAGRIHYDRTWEGMTWVVKRPGNVDVAMGVVTHYEKGSHSYLWTDTGIGIFSKKAFNFPHPEVFDFADVYHHLITKYHLGVKVLQPGDTFYEIGSVKGLEEARRALSE
jgi:NDP-sugar pyrophosphorylase family protein